jgi:formamidopyrimidine-DNA glycosylase
LNAAHNVTSRVRGLHRSPPAKQDKSCAAIRPWFVAQHPSAIACDDAAMPELPEVEAVRRRLETVMRGAAIVRVRLRRKDLRRPFPPRFAARIEGQDIRAVERRGKYLLVRLRSGDTLLMHLGMSGSFRVVPAPTGNAGSDDVFAAGHHDHVVFDLSNGATVVFNDPRRFGLMDVIAGGADGGGVDALGPEPLAAEFDGAVLAAACAGKRSALKVTLLDQRVVAGIGNIYASEALHRAALSPLRRASTIATASGRPRPHAVRLAAAIKATLNDAIAQQERRSHRGRFLVYEREGEPCRRRGCGGTIKRVWQAGRSTFYCPRCQR